MNFLDLKFLLLLLVLVIVYYIVPKKHRYIILLIGSYIFYGFNNINCLIILFMATLLTYIGGLILEKRNDKKIFALFFILNILILIVFKYTNFLLQSLNIFNNMFNISTNIKKINILLPVGLSFYIFQSCSYLSDVYRKKGKAEKNFFIYATFVSFFPTILSGPIQKSRNLLPQIKKPKDFDSENAISGFVLFVWGMFQKVVIANQLSVITNTIYNNYTQYDSIYLIMAAICFSLYIYADFSSYSDMARGISKLFNIEIDRNFKNPYLSQSLSEFWTRWHISLNEWFVENVYIPLGGNRKGTTRKYINMMVVFFISGLWHGAHFHFIVWGVLNGLLVIIGLMTKKYRKKIYETLKIDEEKESIVFMKRAIVFIIITFTWIFFANGYYESIDIIKKILDFRILDLFNPFVTNTIAIISDKPLIFISMLFIFLHIQCSRKDGEKYYKKIRKQPVFIQCLVLAIFLYISIFAMTSNAVEANTNFLYFQF